MLMLIVAISCNPSLKKIKVDKSKHLGLKQLKSSRPHKVLYSEGHIEQAERQASLIKEAYGFLSDIMGKKNEFYLLVVAEEDWEKNAYSPVSGMPEYYKGNLIVGAGQNRMATGYAEMIESFPREKTTTLYDTYADANGKIDMKLFFDKLAVHELTHNFQDPKNGEGFSMARWLEEIHANMGLYAYYKTRPKELKYITKLVEFSLENPPPDLEFVTLADFDKNYYQMSPETYGFYQMKFTKIAQKLIDSLGNDILKPLNDFIIKYDETWREKLTEKEFNAKLSDEVEPYFMYMMDNWHP